MFQKTQYKFLLSYIVIFTALLATFALAVRFVFSHSLKEKLIENLTILGRNAAISSEFDDEKLNIDSDFPVREFIARHQALQWFDSQCKLVLQQGEYVLSLPINPEQKVQQQRVKGIRLQSVTLPINSYENNRLIGYVRVSQSLEDFDETIARLDIGLGCGVVITLALSCIGGVFLTRKAMQPIEESFLKLKQFTADASHELRSPLMAITANVEVALENPEEFRPKDIKKFKAIASATDQMTCLVEDLLLLARSDQVEKPRYEAVNIEEILYNLLELYELQANHKKINFKVNIAESLYVLGDNVQLTRVFANLIENALQYTPLCGAVEINAVRNGQQVCVKVKDTGIGMTPEQLEQIFERFWRASEARSYRAGGFGLGLAIVKSFVKNHSGNITVTSQLNIGSCFTVSLPMHRS
ncbi:two-component sensor histidine kinase [Calothrix sp. HK-06]|nr:two-component sensor histidine kinase [Calothrix sp. HK-06]